MNEGAIAIELQVRGGRVADVAVRSSRPVGITRALEGLDVAQALKTVRALFAVCGAAHGAAAEEACERALGLPADPLRRGQRQLACALEAIENHAFQICVEWPRALGRAPSAPALLRTRKATAAVRSALGSATLSEALAALDEAVRELAPDEALAGDDGALLRWASRSEAPVALWLREILEAGAADFGGARARLLPPLDEAWFEAALQQEGFGAAPTYGGEPAESGAVALAAEHPAVAQQLSRHGRSLVSRSVAHLADLRRIAAEVVARAPAVAPSNPRPLQRHGSGHACGVADTARGRLAHSVVLVDGRVARWRTVAPTEWTFHPRGAIREALLGAATKDLDRRARWLVTAMDPCVPCSISVVGASHA